MTKNNSSGDKTARKIRFRDEWKIKLKPITSEVERRRSFERMNEYSGKGKEPYADKCLTQLLLREFIVLLLVEHWPMSC